MSTPSQILNTRTDLSLLYRVLRTVIKPLRPNLVKPGKPQPAGSPKLKAPSSKNSCSIRETQHSTTKVWTYTFVPEGESYFDPFAERADSNPSKIQVLYFAGGGFQSPPSSEHWGFVSWFASELRQTHQFVIVSYPLAPHSPACESLPICRLFLKEFMGRLGVSGRVVLMGDSAGGNIALSLAMWWVEQMEQVRKVEGVSEFQWQYEVASKQAIDQVGEAEHSHVSIGEYAVLDHILVVSPAVDMRNVNPEIEEANRHDPVLTEGLTSSVAEAWCMAPETSSSNPPPGSEPKGIDPADASVSPLLASDATFAALKAQNVRVNGIFGTHDVLGPDTELMRQKLIQHGVDGRWLKWQGQMHCFPLASVYGLKEGKEGRAFVFEVLRG